MRDRENSDQEPIQEQALETPDSRSYGNLLSRRDLLRYAGYSVGGAALMALLRAPAAAAHLGPPPEVGHVGGRSGHTLQLLESLQNGNASGLQLPFWANGGSWNEAEYYSTIQAHRRFGCKTYQSSDIDGDGQDELIARHIGGVQIVRYNAAFGQWIDLLDGPPLSDLAGWNGPTYYETIQCADLDSDGQAEIIARGYGGIFAWRYDNDPSSPTYQQWPQLANGPGWGDPGGWNLPQYYTTIQCADIDGDGRAELLGRDGDGIQVWKYDGTANAWSEMPRGPGLSDAGGWNQPPYYETIQCADLDSDGQAEIIARGYGGAGAWRYDNSPSSPTYQQWVQVNSTIGWSDPAGWGDPTKYETIQWADIDGDGAAELLGRGANGIEVYKYDPKANTLNQLPNGPAWSDSPGGWNKAEFATTIQCADIDGDGAAELFARNYVQIEVWKYHPTTQQWNPLPAGPNWGDTAGWDVVEQYSTIQTAKIKTAAGATQYALLGRAPLSMQTYLYSASSQQWQNSSAPFPTFTAGQEAAYQALGTALGSDTPIRARYSDLSGILTTWYNMLLAGEVAKPDGIAQADWDAVTGQIKMELGWVTLVQNRYAVLTNNLITDMFLSKDLTLQTIGDYMNIPGDDPTQLGLSILNTIASALSGIFSFLPEPFNLLSGVASLVSTAVSAGQTYMPNGGNAYQIAYAQLGEDLANSFSATLTGNDNNLFLITGGLNDGGAYVPGDYGLLAAIGTNITNGTWAWPETTENIVAATQRGYAISLWQTLAAAKWSINPGLPSGYPQQYAYSEGGGNWLYIGNSNANSYPDSTTLSPLFDSNPGGVAFPLGVNLYQVYHNQNGWNIPSTLGASLSSPSPSPVILLGPKIHVDGLQIRRDPKTDAIIVAVTIADRGLSAATNLDFTKVQIRQRRLPIGQKATAVHARPHLRIGLKTVRTIYLHFPAQTAVTGMLLNMTGRFKGGTFGFNIPLPAL
jgi:hypothetical protein